MKTLMLGIFVALLGFASLASASVQPNTPIANDGDCPWNDGGSCAGEGGP